MKKILFSYFRKPGQIEILPKGTIYITVSGMGFGLDAIKRGHPFREFIEGILKRRNIEVTS